MSNSIYNTLLYIAVTLYIVMHIIITIDTYTKVEQLEERCDSLQYQLNCLFE